MKDKGIIFVKGSSSNNMSYWPVIFIIYLLQSSPLFSQVINTESNKYNNISDTSEVSKRDMVSVFLDCSACDNSYIRQQIYFVNYVRDVQLSQIHIFITKQYNASGGGTFTFSFIGKKDFDGINNNLTYTSIKNNTEDEVRKGLTKMILLGLVPYISQTSLADRITIAISGQPDQQRHVIDPWNNWIFEVYGGFNFAEETSKSSLDLRYGFSAEYVTKKWRIRMRPYFNYNQETFVKEGEDISSVLHRDGFKGKFIRSISDHWSVGSFTSIISNTYENIDFGYRIAPAIEYSLLPYKKALRNEYTIAYSIGYLRRRYLEETIYGKDKEILFDQSLKLEIRALQPWGSIRAGLKGSHFFHDLSKNRISFDSRLSIRIFRGLSVTFSSNYDYVQDQLSLPKGDASLEEILLGQRQLPTTYGISVSAGLSYSFGSIYNNVVNTRL